MLAEGISLPTEKTQQLDLTHLKRVLSKHVGLFGCHLGSRDVIKAKNYAIWTILHTNYS